jgi:hypothetical protein
VALPQGRSKRGVQPSWSWAVHVTAGTLASHSRMSLHMDAILVLQKALDQDQVLLIVKLASLPLAATHSICLAAPLMK